jgi:hypothetical protein
MTLGEDNPVSLWYTRTTMVTEAFAALNVGHGYTASLGEPGMPTWFEDKTFWMALYPDIGRIPSPFAGYRTTW